MHQSDTLQERATVLLRFDPELSAELRAAAAISRKTVKGFVQSCVEQAMRERRAGGAALECESQSASPVAQTS